MLRSTKTKTLKEAFDSLAEFDGFSITKATNGDTFNVSINSNPWRPCIGVHGSIVKAIEIAVEKAKNQNWPD